MHSRTTVAMVLGALVLATAAAAPADASGRKAGAQPIVFKAETQEGQVWVNVDLTRHRSSEPYVPVVVAVSNRAKSTAVLDRTSFTVVGADGRQEPMASLEAVRKGYPKLNFDMSMIRVYGMPAGTWLQENRLVPSNFFPIVGRGSGVVIDHVEVPPLFWMIDVLYFKTPEGLAAGNDVKLVVHPEGWKHPVTVVFHV